MRALDTVFAWAMVVLGIVHAAATVTMRPVSLGTVWFFSGGAAIIMAGLLNLVRIRRSSGFERGCAIFANLLVVAVLVGVTWFLVHRLRQNPQVLIAWGITVLELLFSLRGRR